MTATSHLLDVCAVVTGEIELAELLLDTGETRSENHLHAVKVLSLGVVVFVEIVFSRLRKQAF